MRCSMPCLSEVISRSSFQIARSAEQPAYLMLDSKTVEPIVNNVVDHSIPTAHEPLLEVP